jgi:hypothetical protein
MQFSEAGFAMPTDGTASFWFPFTSGATFAGELWQPAPDKTTIKHRLAPMIRNVFSIVFVIIELTPSDSAFIINLNIQCCP